METNELQISRNIKSCREKYGKTQDDICKILNCSKPTYVSIENNPMSYPINKLQLVAEAIGCNIDDFFLKK